MEINDTIIYYDKTSNAKVDLALKIGTVETTQTTLQQTLEQQTARIGNIETSNTDTDVRIDKIDTDLVDINLGIVDIKNTNTELGTSITKANEDIDKLPTKTLEILSTTDKTLVGSINELKIKIDESTSAEDSLYLKDFITEDF